MADIMTGNSSGRDRSYLRKIKKPIIEKKRRDRINTCLTQLKELLLQSMNQNGNAQVSKLDKADILEMTVSHLKQIKYQQMAIAMATSSAVSQYREGYAECSQETVRYLESTQGSRHSLSSRVEKHLSGVVPSVAMPTDRPSVKSEQLTVHCSQVEVRSTGSSLLMPVPVCLSQSMQETKMVAVGCQAEAEVRHGVYDIPTCSSAQLSPPQSPETVWRPW